MRLITLDNLNHFKEKMKESIDAELSQSLVCIGTVFQYAGSIAPKGYLLCEGQAVSRIEYSNLFKVISTTYGNGDGSTTFNLPDMRECVPVGAGASTRTDIGTHDALELGKYRADSFASHGHPCSTADTNHTHGFTTGPMNQHSSGSWGTRVSNSRDDGNGVNRYTPYASGSVSIDTTQRAYLIQRPDDAFKAARELYFTIDVQHQHSGNTNWQSEAGYGNYKHSHTIENTGGTTTHGKQVGFNYIIKY